MPSSSTVEERLARVRSIAEQAELPKPWADYLVFTSWRESRANPEARNDRASEARAAAIAFDRNRKRFSKCSHPESEYTFGSGGLFGFIPAIGLIQLGPELRCLPPSIVFDPGASVAMAVGFAKGLMKRSGYKKIPSWLNLRAMWGAPSRGGKRDAIEARRPHYLKDVAAVGLPPEWLDEEPPTLTLDPADVYARVCKGWLSSLL